MDIPKSQIIDMLLSQGSQAEELYRLATETKLHHVGDSIYLRGLIEYSNVCRKQCHYCGINSSISDICRYTLSADQTVLAAQYALDNGYGSVVIQAGEQTDKQHIANIEQIIRRIVKLSNGTGQPLGITLSLGEQSLSTYQRWFEAGAHRYLLRIETSDPKLYSSIHPNNSMHRFATRLEAIHNLRKAGYQLGTGVMIGLPNQSVEQLAEDLLFMRDLDIDMCGMGPYITSEGTHMSRTQPHIPSVEWRTEMTVKMVSVLRLLMPDINIAATTALGTLSAQARMRAIEYGANVIMPNITPTAERQNYNLYSNKSPELDLSVFGDKIAYNVKGDSIHDQNRKPKQKQV